MDEQGKSRYSDETWVNEAAQSDLSSPNRSRREHEEEFAAEIAAAPLMYSPSVRTADEDRVAVSGVEAAEEASISRTFGWLAITAAIVSLFIWPVVLGVSGIVLGLIAYMRGTKGLGAWSIVIGGISVLAFIVMIPRIS